MWRHEIHSSASRLFASSILTICVVALVLGACNIYPTPTPTATPAPTPTPTPSPTPTPLFLLTPDEAIAIVQNHIRHLFYRNSTFYEVTGRDKYPCEWPQKTQWRAEFKGGLWHVYANPWFGVVDPGVEWVLNERTRLVQSTDRICRYISSLPGP
jgi:hypothetical protein